MTGLERLQHNGIRRVGSKIRFRYVGADGKSVRRADLVRIKALRIPPAWTQVAINRAAGGALQAVGKDAAGRWQYLYHENQVKKRERNKFDRLILFGEAVPRMRRVVSRALKHKDLGRDRVMGCILRILSTCLMRAGSQVYANENGSYGLATLKPRHVRVQGDVVEFHFPGKSRIVQHREVKDRAVARVVRSLLKHPAPEVFKYQNGDGGFVDVRRRDINLYIKEVMGQPFTAKDFRTWTATLICASALARAGVEARETAASKKRKEVSAVKETAEVLGNTPAVCRSSYICPDIIDSFKRGEVIKHSFATADLLNHRRLRLRKVERALLRLLKRRTRPN